MNLWDGVRRFFVETFLHRFKGKGEGSVSSRLDLTSFFPSGLSGVNT